MEITKFVKLLLKKEFWVLYSKYVRPTMFGEDYRGLYEALVDCHKRYNRDFTVDDLKAVWVVLNPTATRAQRNHIEEIFLDIEHEQEYGSDIAPYLLRHLWKEETGREIGQLALKIINNELDSLEPIRRIIEQRSEDFLPLEDVEPISNDLDDLIEQYETNAQWKFNLNCLNDKIEGLSEGDFAVIFARPDVGKTGFHVSLSTGPGGWCEQGANVLVIGNEEPGYRTSMRAVSAYTGLTRDEIIAEKESVKPLWDQVRKNYTLIDDVDMTIERLHAMVKRRKPDILIIDQLDKVGVSGNFQRDDQKLREIYVQAREIAKRYKCVVIAISQASAEAEGRTWLSYSTLENSKTGKAAEADLIIGIGKTKADEQAIEEDTTRYLTISKNKLSSFKGKLACQLEPTISRFVDM